jgi:hypothetical protein
MTARRAYRRLTPEDSVRACALWASGAATLEEIAAELGVSTRALQLLFKKHGTVKGSEAAATAKTVVEAIIAEEFGSLDDRIGKGKTTLAQSYAMQSQLSEFLGAIFNQIAADPVSAYKHSASIKSLAIAAVTVDRLSRSRLSALGVSIDHIDNPRSPPLIINGLDY